MISKAVEASGEKTEQNLRGAIMRKVITTLVLGALCVALFSSPAQALQFDPRKGRADVALPHANNPSGDDSGWADEKSPIGPNGCLVWTFGSGLAIVQSAFFVIGWTIVPSTDTGGDDIGNNGTGDTDTTLEVRGTSSR